METETGMGAIYNEIEPYAATWLRNLEQAGHIAQGHVDERSIRELQPDDVRDFTQAHFFAGIGVWSHALRLAGWPDELPVWTGSCPCQPFSGAGKRGGFSDDRHLWPDWFRLIRECRPPVVFGEQVASPDGYRWLDLVQADVEGTGYAFGAAVLPAAGVGAPHIRHRIYWVAYSDGGERDRIAGCEGRERDGSASGRVQGNREPERRCATRGVADAAEVERRSGRPGVPCDGSNSARLEPDGLRTARGAPSVPGPTNGFWARADWVPCRDGYSRPVEPGTQPLAHWSANRVGCLRAYGNAIVSEVAATFIRAAIHAVNEVTP